MTSVELVNEQSLAFPKSALGHFGSETVEVVDILVKRIGLGFAQLIDDVVAVAENEATS
jgi:hypothetical protein